jgi:multidrug transporter EmrE-like cation transporter
VNGEFMIPVYSLIFATLICCLYTFLNYAIWFKNWNLFYVAVVILGAGMSIPWAFIVKYTLTKESLFLYSISWDVMVTVISLVIPILLYGVKFSFANWIGIGLIVAGIFTLKISNI